MSDSEKPDAANGGPPAATQPIPINFSRRKAFGSGAASGLAAGLGAACAVPVVGQLPLPGEQSGRGTPSAPAEDALAFFTPEQAAIVKAACARIIPTDEHGPGATEAGLVFFLDRQLSSQTGIRGKEYKLGPFEEGLETQGDQSRLTLQERYRLGLAGLDSYARSTHGKGFAELGEPQQDAVLRDLETGRADAGQANPAIQNVPVEPARTGPEAIQHASPGGKVFGLQAFFAILRGHTIGGFFSDPGHGGNRDMVGWKLIGFPGAQIGGYRNWILNYGVPFPHQPTSLAAYQQKAALKGHDHTPHLQAPNQSRPLGAPTQNQTGGR